MWVDANGRTHSVAVEDSELVLDDESLERIYSASEETLIATVKKLETFPFVLFERGSGLAVDAAFENADLPSGTRLSTLKGSELAEAIMHAVDQAPVRWQVELFFAVLTVLSDRLDELEK